MAALLASLYLPSQWPRTLQRLALVSLILHLTAAYFGLGFYHADEHFQILEWARLKLTGNAVDLPWEYREQMRPWLQPAIVYLVAKAWTAMGVDDPFRWVQFLQAATAIKGWFLMGAVAICSPLWIKRRENQNLAVALAFGLWFLPYLQARVSSENWSSLCLWFGVLGLALLWRNRSVPGWAALGIGFLFGLSFDFRFQIGFALVGVAAWCLLERIPLSTLAVMFVGILLAMGLGAVVDYWGYGHWVFSPWNYLHSNVVDDKLSSFGILPWWGYFPRIILDAVPPVGVVLILGVIAGWCYSWRSVITLTTATFILVHFFIGHKETRFFFPVIPVLPVLLAVGWEGLKSSGWFRPSPRLVRALAIALALFNGCLLVGGSFVPPRTEMPYEHWLVRHGIRKIHYVRVHPYDLGLKIHFYRPADTELIRLTTWKDLATLPYARTETLWVHSDGLVRPPPFLEDSGAQCELRHTTMPDWALKAFRPILVLSKTLVLSLYECHYK